ncbi:putative linker histone H1/H5, domain H15, AT hook, DNA-binding protein [Helianthus debilis subsp. tardiflorus]
MESFAPPEHHATPPFSGNSAHPPYPEMIMAAIAALDDKDGSSRQAIAKYIEREYSNLPPTHPNLLTHHLKRMKNEGQLIMIKHSYAFPPPRSVPFQPPTTVMDNHFTDYTITGATDEGFVNSASASVTPRRKPGRPPKPRHDFGYQVPDEQQPPEIQPYQPQFETQTQTQIHLGQGESEGNYAEPPIFASLGLADDAPRENAVVSAKRGRGRPPKSANASGGTASVGGSEGRRKRGRPKLLSISRVNGGVSKRGRPKRIGGIVTVPLSGNVASPRGRPKRAVSGDARSGSVSRGRGRPPKNKFRNSFGSPSKVGPGTAVIVTDPHQLVAYQELKLKYEHLQSKAKEVVGVVRPYINPDYEAFGALQELEMLVGTYAVVESEKRQPYA